MTMVASVTGQRLSVTATLGSAAAKSRFGVAYLRAVCSQAGVGLSETSPDEDVLAVDCLVSFREADVRVQVKCTSQFKIAGRSASWPMEPQWLVPWQQSLVPVYVVLVIVGQCEQRDWLLHQNSATVHRAAAFWTRVDGASEASRITVPKSQRLTVDTLSRWRTDALAAFGVAKTGGGDVP